MKEIIKAQELARRFNEDETVWHTFEEKRALRKLLGSDAPLPKKISDWLDWQEAERECRVMRAVGFFQP